MLTNLAREAGYDNIANITLVMKRCFSQDISIPDERIINTWLFKSESLQDLFVFQTDKAFYFVFLEQNKMVRHAFLDTVKDVIFMDKIILVLTFEKKVIGIKYSF